MRLTIPLLCLSTFAAAEPLPEHDNGPLTGLYGLPGVDEGGTVLDRWRLRADFSVISASHSVVDASGSEQLVLDGESIRTTVDLRLGLPDGIEVGVEIPWVAHHAGGLDSLIDTWHDIFRLPEGDRDDRPQDLLEFSFADAGGEVVNFTDSSRGIGDLRVYAGFDLGGGERHRRALRFGVKLPTGDAAKLTGSGGTDASLGIAGDIESLNGSAAVSAFYRAGLVYLGKPELLADRYEDYVVYLGGGLGYRLNDRWQFNAQASYRSAIYDAGVEQLGDSLLTLTFGGNISLSRALVLSLAVTEDINVNSAADVAFNVALRYRPD